MKATDPRVPKGGSVGEGGVILDASGNPVLGKDGKPMYVKTAVKEDNTPGAGGPNTRERASSAV